MERPTSSNTTLNVKVRGGWSWSALPPQRIFDLVGSSTGFVPDWGFNALKTKEFSGDKCLSLYVEHNLGNVFHRWGDISFLEDYTLSIMGGGAWSDIFRRIPPAYLCSGSDGESGVLGSGIWHWWLV